MAPIGASIHPSTPVWVTLGVCLSSQFAMVDVMSGKKMSLIDVTGPSPHMYLSVCLSDCLCVLYEWIKAVRPSVRPSSLPSS